MLPVSPTNSPGPTLSPDLSNRFILYEDRPLPPTPNDSESPSSRRIPSMSSPNYWGTHPTTPSDLRPIHDNPTQPHRARVRQHRSLSSSSDHYDAMGSYLGHNRPGSSSPESSRQPRPLEGGRNDSEPPPYGDEEIRVHPLIKLRRWLWILLVILLCIIACIIWSSTTSSLIMVAYCIAGCCQNCAHRRTGGCHDCPLLCDGMERSLAWSIWGCRHFIRYAKQLLTSREEWEVIRERIRPIVTPPDTLYRNPTRNVYFGTFAAAFDNVVDDLNDFAGRAVDATESWTFYTIDAMIDASAPPHRHRHDDAWC